MPRFVAAYLAICIVAARAFAAAASASPVENPLTPLQQKQAEQAVDKALAWLASQQQPDGSFPSIRQGLPGVTGLCVLAFLSRGHQPGEGPYGDNITRAIEYLLSCQSRDGMLALGPIEPTFVGGGFGHAGTYSHAVAGLALSECYGMVGRELSQRIKPAVESARDFTLKFQGRPKRELDVGGWRYLRPHHDADSDLSVTSWHLLFLRSAKNAGIDVPSANIDAALAYVERSFHKDQGFFTYTVDNSHLSRGMVGAGILSLSLAGKHDSDMAHRAGQWILRNGFTRYNQPLRLERWFISVFYCTQGMFQLGGKYWRDFYPPTIKLLIDNQQPDGWWEQEDGAGDYGTCMTTAFCVLTLDTPNLFLPIFQR
jgi:hypothetical protein